MDEAFTVVIFGPVGCGKSSVVAHIRDTFLLDDVVVVREPTEALMSSGALDQLYAGFAGSVYTLQMLVLAERLSTYFQTIPALRRVATPVRRTIVMDGYLRLDGPIFLDTHARNNAFSDEEQCGYEAAVDSISRLIPAPFDAPHLYVYLRASASVCLDRARCRSRHEEAELSLDFFARLCDACGHVANKLLNDAGSRVVCVNADESLDVVARNVAAQVKRVMREMQH